MEIMGRTINRNEMLCDGTPRRENGYRAYVHVRYGDIHPLTGLPINTYCKSPLFKSEKEAEDWTPPPKTKEG